MPDEPVPCREKCGRIGRIKRGGWRLCQPCFREMYHRCNNGNDRLPEAGTLDHDHYYGQEYAA